MSHLYTPHFPGDPRTLERPGGEAATRADGTTVPSAVAGYEHGCTFRKRNGTTAADALYVNIGSATSCNFKLLQSTTDAVALTATAAEINSVVHNNTATAAELSTLHTQTLATGAGAGFTDGVGAICKNSVQLSGGIYYTRIMLDLTGTASSTTDLDIIGSGTSPAYLGQLTAAANGTILEGTLTCMEVPTGGVADIDLYWATEATGKFDDGVAALTETALVTSGGNWTLALTKAIADPVGIANGYLYLTGGAAGTAATYTAGKFLLQLFGY